jgi:DNA-binding NtrC family response regulator
MPVIIHTRRPSLHSAVASIQLRVTAYLVKPVPFDVLRHHVKTSIGNYHDRKLHESEDKIKQIELLTNTIEETIQVLQSTRSSFKSKKLAALRRKLERIMAGKQQEPGDQSNSGR